MGGAGAVRPGLEGLIRYFRDPPGSCHYLGMPGTVLIVEDDAIIRCELEETLAERGYRVYTAANGSEALTLLGRIPVPNVIVLDMMMPIMNGAQFLGKLRANPRFESISIVMMSAWIHPWTNRLAEAEEIEILMKPFALQKLVDSVARCCRREHPPRPTNTSEQPAA